MVSLLSYEIIVAFVVTVGVNAIHIPKPTASLLQLGPSVCLLSTSVTTVLLVTMEMSGLPLGFVSVKKPIKLVRHDARPGPKCGGCGACGEGGGRVGGCGLLSHTS